VQGIGEKGGAAAEPRVKVDAVEGGDLVHEGQVEFLQPFKIGGLDAGDEPEGQWRQKGGLVARGDNIFPQGFYQARCHLGHQLVGPQGPYGGQSQGFSGLALQPPGHVHRRAEETAGAGDVHKEVAVVLSRFHQGGEGQGLVQQAGHGLFVARRLRRQNTGPAAQPRGPAQGHSLANAVLVGLFAHVVHRGPGGALGCDDHRPAFQPVIGQPLYGHGKISYIDMDDGSFHYSMCIVFSTGIPCAASCSTSVFALRGAWARTWLLKKAIPVRAWFAILGMVRVLHGSSSLAL
jgi:hypothetical protein